MFGSEDKDQSICTESNVNTYVSEDVETPNELHVDNDVCVNYNDDRSDSIKDVNNTGMNTTLMRIRRIMNP
ncbi:hypothetical protein Tco_1298062, partial [Tanacetum coccineum]